MNRTIFWFVAPLGLIALGVSLHERFSNEPTAKVLGPASAASATIKPVKYGKENLGSRVRLVARRGGVSVLIRAESGEEHFKETLRFGDSYQVPNQEGYYLATNDAGGLDVILDGRELGPVGKDGEIYGHVSLDPLALADRIAPGKYNPQDLVSPQTNSSAQQIEATSGSGASSELRLGKLRDWARASLNDRYDSATDMLRRVGDEPNIASADLAACIDQLASDTNSGGETVAQSAALCMAMLH